VLWCEKKQLKEKKFFDKELDSNKRIKKIRGENLQLETEELFPHQKKELEERKDLPEPEEMTLANLRAFEKLTQGNKTFSSREVSEKNSLKSIDI